MSIKKTKDDVIRVDGIVRETLPNANVSCRDRGRAPRFGPRLR